MAPSPVNYASSTALVTGGSSGIGQAIAAELIKRGVKKLVIVAHSQEGYREFRQMGGFGGMLENDPTATRLVLMDSYGIGHTISVVRPIIGPMLRPLCSKNT